MNISFSDAKAHWVKYSEYVYRKSRNGVLYLMPSETAVPDVYDPTNDAERLVIDALNVGRLAMKGSEEKLMQDAVMKFVSQYGLLGFMPALPTTPEFMDYNAVYLPKNHFIREESVSTKNYLSMFYLFSKPDIYMNKEMKRWDIRIDGSRKEIGAVVMAFGNEPWSVPMSMLPIYAERYDWLVTQFKDWAYMLVASFLFYEDRDKVSEDTLNMYQLGLAAFGSKVPTYHIGLSGDSPRIVWDFHSLLLTINTLFAFALTDEKRPLRICKNCNNAYIAKHRNAEYCSTECKTEHAASDKM